MASDLKEAVENFKSTANHFRAVLELADKMEEVGDMKRAAKEAEGSLAAAKRDLAEVAKELADKKAKSKGMLTRSNEQAEQIVGQANAEAREILLTVKEQAAADAKQIKDAAQGAANTAKAREEASTKAAVEAEAREAAAEVALEEIEAKIAKARETIAAFTA